MIIDKIAEFWTPEMIQRQEAIYEEVDALNYELDELLKAESLGTGTFTDKLKELNHSLDALTDELAELELAVKRTYRANKSDRAIIADVREVLTAITPDDYLEYLSQQIKRYSVLLKLDNKVKNFYDLSHEKTLATEGYESCICFLQGQIARYLDAVSNSRNRKSTIDKITELVRQTALQWYPERPGALLPVAHGKPTDAMACMVSRRAEISINEITGTSTLEWGGVELFFDRIIEKFGIAPHKLLMLALVELTKQNSFRYGKEGKEEEKKDYNRTVIIPLRQYAEMVGYDIAEKETHTQEEAKAEKKRINSLKKKVSQEVKNNLLQLGGAFTWDEKGVRHTSIYILSGTETRVKSGEIIIIFNYDFVNYLFADRKTLTQLPATLLTIDSRDDTAYRIGYYLSTHYFMDHNKAGKTHNKLLVKNILERSGLTAYEKVMQEYDRNWQARIKEPFESALDVLTGSYEKGGRNKRVLADWKYTHAGRGGLELSDSEIDSLTYRQFENLYLEFEMADDINDSERIAANLEKKKKAAAEKEKRASRMIDANTKKKLVKELKAEMAQKGGNKKPTERGQADG